MSTETVLIFALIIANGVFAMSEMAIVASRKARLQHRADRGSRASQIALDLANNPNEFLSTVQIGITVVGSLASAFGGATLAEELAVYLDQYPWIAPHGETMGLIVVVAIISYVSLVLGELVPKRIALQSPEAISTLVAPLMRSIAFVSSPAVRFLGFSSDLVLRLIPAKTSTETEVTEEEIKGLINQAVRAGTVHRVEEEMIRAIFQLGDRRVYELMTPRKRVAWLDVEAHHSEVLEMVAKSHYSKYPLCKDNLDNVVGTVHVKDLVIRDNQQDLRKVMKEPFLIPATMTALKLVSRFQQSHKSMALVIDEHGGVQGLITLTDILETIVGDLPSLGQPKPPGAMKRQDGSWLIDGALPLADLKERLMISSFPDEEGVVTVAGLVLVHLGRIPSVGDIVNLSTIRIEVVDMDGTRIDKLIIIPISVQE